MKTTRRSRRDARRLYRACLSGGLLDEARARRVAERVARSGRRGSLAVLAHFRRLVSLDGDAHRAVVESATALPDDFRSGVATDVTRLYGPGMTTSFEENPALIAGMRVKVGSDVYDGSVRAALATLGERFR
jgi:F-type H+-transporting ATPase subunit delta